MDLSDLRPSPVLDLRDATNQVRIEQDGTIFWNGQRIDYGMLNAFLDQVTSHTGVTLSEGASWPGHNIVRSLWALRNGSLRPIHGGLEVGYPGR